ncbi:MAG TPA: hypothetical protein VJ579_02580 [Candidatus Paceibacterota bacterium]|nr:hypothetical protein [Candidatus Paceibacterota bacterium]
MYKLSCTLRNEIEDLVGEANLAMAKTKVSLIPYYAAADKLFDAGHSATASQMTKPIDTMFKDWEVYRSDLIELLDAKSRTILHKSIKHIKGLIKTLNGLQELKEPYEADPEPEIALRRLIGERYSETLCLRNELAKHLDFGLQMILRKEPFILKKIAIAFEIYNGIEHCGRLHTFAELEKLSESIENAKVLITECIHLVTNYTDGLAK